jgi:hypothetical protein
MKRLIAAALVVMSTSAFAGWTMQKQTDPMTDTVKAYASVQDGERNAQLLAFCDSKFKMLTLIVSWNKWVGLGDGYITARVDKNPAHDYRYTALNGTAVAMNSLTSPKATTRHLNELTPEMLSGDVLAVRADSGAFAQFNITGYKTVINELFNYCKEG